MPAAAVTPDFSTDPRWGERLVAARAALAEVGPAFVELLRSVRNPGLRAVGEWSIAEVAAHVSHVCMGDLMVAGTVGSPLPDDLGQGDDVITAAEDFNSASLAGDPERNLGVLADRIEHSVKEMLDVMGEVRGDEATLWIAGMVIPSSGLVIHVVEELLVHGWDIARAEGKPWPIRPDHAALAFGFVIDLLRLARPAARRAFVVQDAARGLRACFEFRLRGQRRDYFVFEDGQVTVEDPSARRVDCHISADPVAGLLVGMGRISQNKPILTGKLFAWGRKPWLSMKFGSLLRNP